MILQALCDYYERKPDLPRQGFELKEIPFVLEIDASGRLVQIEDTRTRDGKKLRARAFLVPQGEKKSSGVKANLFWENVEYILGVSGRGADKLAEKQSAFRLRLAELALVCNDEALSAIDDFLEQADIARLERDPLWPEVLETNALLSFRISGDLELACQRPAIRAALTKRTATEQKIICLVNGEEDEFERLHTAIKGVWGAQTSGANIVSFNKDAFNSFGKEQGSNAPVGKRAAFAYTTALNQLLANGSRQRIQVGDTSTVFWSAKETRLEDDFADLFGDPPKDDDDPARHTRAVEALLNAPQGGAYAEDERQTRFFVLGLAPNAARIAVRFWHVGTVGEMAERVRQHFADIEIAHASFDKPHLSIWRLLVATAAQGKTDNIPPNLAGDFMRCIIAGLPYPQTLLQATIRRIRSEQSRKDPTTGKVLPNVSYPRAALIKACLNRQARAMQSTDKEISVSLDDSNTNPGYLLGRLFAVLEKVQEDASPGLNATIRDRFYGAASSTPVAVFSNLMKLKNHHLAKLEEGRKRYFEKLIGQIMSGITDFPAHLSLADQGRFAIGYYHQRQAFFTKSEHQATAQPNQGETA